MTAKSKKQVSEGPIDAAIAAYDSTIATYDKLKSAAGRTKAVGGKLGAYANRSSPNRYRGVGEIKKINQLIYTQTQKFAALMANALKYGYKGVSKSGSSQIPSSDQSPASPDGRIEPSLNTPPASNVPSAASTAAVPSAASTSTSAASTAARQPSSQSASRAAARRAARRAKTAGTGTGVAETTQRTKYTKLNALFESILEDISITEFDNSQSEQFVKLDITQWLNAAIIKGIDDEQMQAAALEIAKDISDLISKTPGGNKINPAVMKKLQELVTLAINSMDLEELQKQGLTTRASQSTSNTQSNISTKIERLVPAVENLKNIKDVTDLTLILLNKLYEINPAQYSRLVQTIKGSTAAPPGKEK